MSSSAAQPIQAFEWGIMSTIAIIASIINLIILKKEYTKRKSTTIIFFSKWTKHTSIICIICGTLYSVITILQGMTLFCYIESAIRYLLIPIQGNFMGFNQISRLYYCFSQTSTHSTKGYSTWLFIFMIGHN